MTNTYTVMFRQTPEGSLTTANIPAKQRRSAEKAARQVFGKDIIITYCEKAISPWVAEMISNNID